MIKNNLLTQLTRDYIKAWCSTPSAGERSHSCLSHSAQTPSIDAFGYFAFLQVFLSTRPIKLKYLPAPWSASSLYRSRTLSDLRSARSVFPPLCLYPRRQHTCGSHALPLPSACRSARRRGTGWFTSTL